MSSNRFIGRSDELAMLNQLANKKTASLVVIRGRRRIGKTRLVEEFAKQHLFLRFEGLAPSDSTTAQDQRDHFSSMLNQQTDLPDISVDDWSKLFSLLAQQARGGKVVILLDEISWMAHGDRTFLAKLKSAWDTQFSKNSNLILIICGSVSMWIEHNILNSTGFIGRITLELILRELTLLESNALLNALDFKRSSIEKLLYLSLTGSIPWYIEQINSKLSALLNIRQLCFRPNALMVNEFERVFHDLFGKRGEIYKEIVKHLHSQPLEYSEIAKKINYPKGSALTGYLNELAASGYISCDFTWSIPTGKQSKLSKYRVCDNYLRFYFRFIQNKITAVNKGLLKSQDISSLPGFATVMGLQFENLVLNNRQLVWDELNIETHEIVQDGPFFQRKTARNAGCQVDYLIQTKTNTLFVCEIKFTRHLKTAEIIEQVKKRIHNMSIPRGFATIPVLIHACKDIDENSLREYFFEIIDIGKYLSNKIVE